MRETLDRFQLLWPKRQRQALTRLAKERGTTLTEMTRQAIEIGIRELEQEDEFTRRGRALEAVAEAAHRRDPHVAAFELAAQTVLPLVYFSSEPSLFPLWPRWHPEWAVALLTTTAVLLFLPKLLSLLVIVKSL